MNYHKCVPFISHSRRRDNKLAPSSVEERFWGVFRDEEKDSWGVAIASLNAWLAKYDDGVRVGFLAM